MNDVIVRRPRLLRKGSSSAVPFTEAGRFNPIRLSIEINMQPLSTATMILAEDDLDVSIHDFVEIYNQHGSVGIFRVASVETNYRNQRTVELNHALDVLNDSVYGRTDADEESFDGTPTAFLEKMLGAQTQGIGSGENITPFWRLGAVSDTEAWRKKLRFANVLEELCDLAKEHEDYYYTFDFSTFPWRVDFVPRPSSSSVVSEFRLNRNITDCSVTLDDDDLCTRLYLSVDVTRDQLIDKDGKDPMKPDTSSDETPGDTASNETVSNEVVSNEGEEGQSTASEEPTVVGEKTEQYFYTFDDEANKAVWGIVSRTAGMEVGKLTFEDDPEALARAYAQQYFRRHGSPTVQITINGQDLKKLTGVNIDEMKMGTICRVALPEYGGTKFVERVVSVSYPDALRQPTVVQVQMANKRASTEDSIAAVKKEAKKAGGGGGGARRKADNLETELEFQKIRYQLRVEQDDKHWAVIAEEAWWEQMIDGGERLIGKYDGQFEITARHMRSIYSATGVLIDPTTGMPMKDGDNYQFGGTGNLYSEIKQTAEALTIEFSRADSAIYSTIIITADGLRGEIASASSDMAAYITATAGEIKTELYKAESSIYSSIRETADEIKLEVAKVETSFASLTITAGEIRSEVHSAQSDIYSSITETAEEIKLEVAKVETSAASLSITAEEIRAEVHSAQSDLYSSITETAGEIRLEVAAVETSAASLTITAGEIRSEVHSAQSSIYTEITQTQSFFRTLAVEMGIDFTSASSIEQTAHEIRSTVFDVDGQKSVISQMASQISAKVGSTDITIGEEDITFKGVGKFSVHDLVVQVGELEATQITADYVDSRVTDVETTLADAVVTDSLTTTRLSVGGSTWASHVIQGWSGTLLSVLGTNDADLQHYHDITCTESGGIVTVEIGRAQTTPGSDSFNIADTQFYQDAVASAEARGASGVTLIEGGWKNGVYHVEATNGEYVDVSLPAFATSGGTFSGNATTTTVTFSTASVATPLAQVLVDAGGVYTNGKTDGQNSVNVSKGRWSGGVITFSPSVGTGSSKTCTLSINKSWSGNVCTLTVMDGGSSTGYSTTVAQHNVDSLASNSATYNGGNSYTIPVNITYDDSDTDTGSIGITVSAAGYQSGSGGGYYTISVNGQAGQQFVPTGAYNAGARTLTESIAYDSSTHKYTGTGTTTLANGSSFTRTATSGTDAYDDGYDIGWGDARAQVSAPGAGTGDTFDFKTPDDTVGVQKTYSFSMSKGSPSASGGYASVKLGQTTVAKISISNWYNGGWNDCRNACSAISDVVVGATRGGYGMIYDANGNALVPGAVTWWYGGTANTLYQRPAAK